MKLTYTPGIAAGLEYLARTVSACADAERHVWVIIPDQMAVTVEDSLSQTASPSAQLYYDIVSFRRLADYIFRSVGGLSYHYADRAAETVVMWRALSACRDSLQVYGNSATPETVPVMMRAVEELKQSMVPPEELMRAAIRLEGDGVNAAKYIDIANIYEVYDELLSESYDDRLSVLTSAVERIRGGNFFAGSDVIVFAFSGFTAQQCAMIREAARSARECEVVFTVPGDARLIGRRPEFDGISETRDRMRAVAGAANVPLSVEVIPRGDESGIDTLVDALWGAGGKISDDVPEDIKIIEATSRRGEAEATAIEISRAVRGGMRYRDIAVCTGSVENYRGIIDTVFESYSIPLHMSYRVRVEEMPETAALMAALRVVTGGWRRDDIAAYIKTGLSGIEIDAEDELLLYLSTWNIGGRRFYDPDGGAWSMNPDGYTARWTEEGGQMLAGVNESRRIVAAPLLLLAEAFSDKTDAKTKTSAVRDFLSSLPDTDDAARSQLVDVVSDALTAVEISSPEGAIKAQDYMSCLRLVVDTLSVGTIPGRTDEVEISTTIGMRGAGHKLVIMLGVADEELPASGGDGFFTEAERLALEGAGITVGESSGYRSAMELYNFSRCAADAKEKLVFTFRTPKGDEAYPAVIERIRELYPAVETVKFKGVLSAEDIYSGTGAISKFTRLPDAALRFAVMEEMADAPEMRRVLAGLQTPISTEYAAVSESTAAKLFGGDLYFSQTKLEGAVSCRFGFYCSYILGLREKKRAEIRANDVGSFIHAVLEKIFSSGLIVRDDVSDEELAEAADGAIGEYIAALCPREENRARQRELFRRLRRSVLLFLRSFREEFAQSLFRPVLFEMPFGMGGDGMPPMRIDLGGGGSAYLRGVADRIDTYRDGEGNLYVRVVDYKTSREMPSLAKISEGHNLQLPLYLYTICNDGDVRALGGEEGDVLVPAGFMYVGVRPEDINAEVGAEDVTEDTRKLPRRGILLADERVLRAQDSGLSGNYIPVSFNKDGSPSAASVGSLSDGEGFERLYGELISTVRSISAELRSGSADTAEDVNACTYCSARAVCRRRE